jgi:hypothetical protein
MTRHHSSFSVVCLFTLIALLSRPASAVEVVIDFQLLEHPGADAVYVMNWDEDGFRLINDIEPPFQPTAFAAWGTGSPDFPGSTALFGVHAPSAITLSRIDGSAFDARGISLAPLSAVFGGGSVTFTGERAGGGVVTQAATFLQSMTLQPFSFDATFANLVALSWEQSASAPHQFDDIRLEVAAIPEPATVLSLVCGLLLLVALHSRTRYRCHGAAPQPI